jgi:hypothetical protein
VREVRKARSVGGLGVGSWSTSVEMAVQTRIAGIRTPPLCRCDLEEIVGDVFETSCRRWQEGPLELLELGLGQQQHPCRKGTSEQCGQTSTPQPH